MATIDPRITPLIETLIASGADWIAVEILNEIRMESPHGDSEEQPLDERDISVRTREGSPVPHVSVSERADARFVDRDGQVEFAIRYALERIAHSIDMAAISLQLLNRIADGSVRHLDIPTTAPVPAANIELSWPDIEGSLGRPQLEDARAKLPVLREALAEWARSVRKGENG